MLKKSILQEKNTYEIEKKHVIKALSKIDPQKPKGTLLFNAVARVSVSVSIDAVCIRRNKWKKNIEVFLTKRSLNDSAYPGIWHVPGSILRVGEEFSDVITRLSKDEFGGNLKILDFLGHLNNKREARGHILVITYLCKTSGKKGTWYSVNALPKNTLKLHKDRTIPQAVKLFKKQNKKTRVKNYLL
ncbi:MAG: NUDIX domain-containing protein [Patescibacteria group bacterium]